MKEISIKKEAPYCKLRNLKGKNGDVYAYWINDVSDIEPTLELGYACTCADNNGSINVWKNDRNEICACLSRFQVAIRQRTFDSYSEMEDCVSEWIKDIE